MTTRFVLIKLPFADDACLLERFVIKTSTRCLISKQYQHFYVATKCSQNETKNKDCSPFIRKKTEMISINCLYSQLLISQRERER